jgi:hypothetical protein
MKNALRYSEFFWGQDGMDLGAKLASMEHSKIVKRCHIIFINGVRCRQN